MVGSETYPGTGSETSVVRLVAPNPGLMTGPGTNTYLIVSAGECVVIDPGPIDGRHRAAIRNALRGLRARAVLVTHTHPDHAPLANPLADELGIRSYGYGPGPGFDPDRRLRHGDRLIFGRAALEVIHTPGHTADHLCFRLGDAVFTGDHVMEGSTVVVEDMADYLRSLRYLRELDPATLFPGHGNGIPDPAAAIDEYLDHRMAREALILEAVRAGARTVGAVVESVYRSVDPRLYPAAATSVVAHLRKLDRDGKLVFGGSPPAGPSGPSTDWNAGIELERGAG